MMKNVFIILSFSLSVLICDAQSLGGSSRQRVRRIGESPDNVTRIGESPDHVTRIGESPDNLRQMEGTQKTQSATEPEPKEIWITLEDEDERTWTSSSGDTIKATLTTFSDEQVHLRSESGDQFSIQRSRLSNQDKTYLDRKAKAYAEERERERIKILNESKQTADEVWQTLASRRNIRKWKLLDSNYFVGGRSDTLYYNIEYVEKSGKVMEGKGYVEIHDGRVHEIYAPGIGTMDRNFGAIRSREERAIGDAFRELRSR